MTLLELKETSTTAAALAEKLTKGIQFIDVLTYRGFRNSEEVTKAAYLREALEQTIAALEKQSAGVERHLTSLKAEFEVAFHVDPLTDDEGMGLSQILRIIQEHIDSLTAKGEKP